jgi:hypothetical protein
MECPPNIHRASTERHAVGCAFLGWACFGRVPFCGLWSLVASFSSLDARGPFACQLLLVLIALPQRFGLKPLHLLLTMHLPIRCLLLQLAVLHFKMSSDESEIGLAALASESDAGSDVGLGSLAMESDVDGPVPLESRFRRTVYVSL